MVSSGVSTVNLIIWVSVQLNLFRITLIGRDYNATVKVQFKSLLFYVRNWGLSTKQYLLIKKRKNRFFEESDDSDEDENNLRYLKQKSDENEKENKSEQNKENEEKWKKVTDQKQGTLSDFDLKGFNFEFDSYLQ